MQVGNTQLLCTFAKIQTYSDEITALFKYYSILDGKVYVLQSGTVPDDVFLTYNAEKNGSEFYPRTMSMHRKKEFNIIYSINALNELIRQENGGVVSRSYQINWQSYSNSLITAREGKVKITPTQLLKIFKI
jgi:hypothetical protein